MQIVIDIDETILKRAKYEYYGENEVNHSLVNEILISVMHGTILPKGHGRLIDADELLKHKHTIGTSNYCEYNVVYVKTIDNTRPIIEADKED